MMSGIVLSYSQECDLYQVLLNLPFASGLTRKVSLIQNPIWVAAYYYKGPANRLEGFD